MALNPQILHLKQLSSITPQFRKKPEENFSHWQANARTALQWLLRLPLQEYPADFRIEWQKSHDNCTEIRFLFESEENVTVSAHLLLPAKPVCGRLPLVICLQGHTTGAHISMGIAKYPGDEELFQNGDRDFARQILARGQAALVLEQRGFGERGGTPRPACTQIAMQALLLGRTLIGERCWDVSRALDMVLEHFPQIDPKKIAIMGNSGGGTVAFYAAALDTRIAACMPSCCFSSYYASIGSTLHCACNHIPGIALNFDMGDIAGLIAPRPLVVVTGKDDEQFPVEAARAQMAIASALYWQSGAPHMARHVIGPEGHRFYSVLSWPVFDELTGWEHI